jgi:vanillate O-demethylase monooxygenase subunit
MRIKCIIHFFIVFKSIHSLHFYNFGLKPVLLPPNENGELTWYPIGFSKDFSDKYPTKVKLRDINYSIWKDKSKYYCVSDVCSHQGASLSKGCIQNENIICPYHGYSFDGKNGNLVSIPHYKINNFRDEKHGIYSYKIIEKGDIIYMNTIPNNDMIDNYIDENKIWIEEEAYNDNFRKVCSKEVFEHHAKFVSINSLDICHISYVHNFGNIDNPYPINNPKIEKIKDTKHHYKIKYEYITGNKSLARFFFNIYNITVENEFILPHTTLSRITFGTHISTIITNAYPISKYKSKLFVKEYRNYWFIKNPNNYFSYVFNYIFDNIVLTNMKKIIREDKYIIDNIDKTDYNTMHGKFSIKYDKLNNLYRHYYKHFYQNDSFHL